MTKDIILTIYGDHATDGVADDPVETITVGQYYWKNEKHYIQFQEILEESGETVKSLLKINGEEVELIRSGAVNTRMHFIKGQETMTLYQTPMGNLPFQIHTEELFLDACEQEISILIQYEIRMNEQVITESTIRMKICAKEAKKLEE